MKELRDTYKKTGTLHHAYLIEGDWEHISSLLFEFFEKDIDMPTQRNPDCHIREYETFNIDDGRVIRNLASGKSFSGGKQLFVLSFHFITREAQNSLLKLLEEPTDNTHFFLVVPMADILLPTVRSRLFQVTTLALMRESRDNWSKLAGKFLKTDRSERLALIKEMVDSKNRQQAIGFINSLELLIRDSGNLKDDGILQTLHELEKCRSYLHDRAPSVKILLEHIAITAPVVSH